MDIFPWIGPITGAFSALTAAGAAVLSWRNKGAIQQVHVSINSRMDELLRVTAIASRAEGIASAAKKGLGE